MINFQDAIGKVAPEIQFIDIDLSVAAVDRRVGISGNIIFADDVAYDDDTTLSASDNVGYAFARLNEPGGGKPFLLKGGRLYQLGNFANIFITHPAQPGQMIRLYFSNGQTIQPFSSSVTLAGGVAITNLIESERSFEFAYHSVGNGSLANETHIVENPVGSSRNIYVRRARTRFLAANMLHFISRMTQTVQDGAFNMPSPKTAGQVSSGTVGSVIGIPGTILTDEIFVTDRSGGAGEIFDMVFKPAIMIPPNAIFAFRILGATGNENVFFEFGEEPV